MKTKLFAFLATLGVARSIVLAVFGIYFLSWMGLVCWGLALGYSSVKVIIFLIALTLVIFGALSKFTAEMLSWDPKVMTISERLLKMLNICISLGLVGLAGVIFVIYYGEVPTFGTIVFGLAELYVVYLLRENKLFDYGRFFGILFIAFIIFIAHTLIIQHYFGRPDGNGNCLIMLVGFYIALVVLTKMPEKIYQSWVNPRIEKKKQEKAEEKRKNDEIAMFWNAPLFGLGNMYIYFSENKIGDRNKKQEDLHLEIFLSRIEKGQSLNVEDTKYLRLLISQTKNKLDSEFLDAVSGQCLINNLSYLVFTTVCGRLSLNEWPVLFKSARDKKAVVVNYLATCPNQECYDSLFSNFTKVFKVDAFTGLVNCLYHFYQKSDDDLEKDIAKKEVQRLVNFAISCYEQMAFLEPTKERLKKRISEITNKFWELGIEI